jgi:hypothetical protein
MLVTTAPDRAVVLRVSTRVRQRLPDDEDGTVPELAD